jgi:thermitase
MRHILAILLLLLGLTGAPLLAEALKPEPTLRWNEKENKLDASVNDWKLDRLLKEIAKVTKWQVLVEPDTDSLVSAKFQGLATREALTRLLKEVSYALVNEDGKTKLLIYRTNPERATKHIKTPFAEENVDENGRITNELIVSLKKGANIEALAARYGAKVVGAIPELGLYRLRFEDSEKADFAKTQLTSFPEVQAVEANYVISKPDTAVAGTGSAALPFSLNPTAATGNSGLVVGLIDTSVQSMGGKLDQFLLKALYANGDPSQSTTPLHGTSMAETILRAMAAASDGGNSTTRILPVDVFGQNESTSTFAVANGIYLAVKNGATIINMSLGSTATASYLETIIANSTAQGVMFLGAAGNVSTDTPTYPAAYSQVIAVTAGSRSGDIASYANYGSFVDIVAPGTSIVTYNGQSYLVGGTSAATATATGVAAQWKAATKASNAQIREKLATLWPRKN